MTQTKPLLTPKEAAEQLGVSVPTVKAWMNRKHNPLPSVEVGTSGRHRRVLADKVAAWLELEATKAAS